MENNTQNNTNPKLSTPTAIILAGLLIAIGIFASNMPAKYTKGSLANDMVIDEDINDVDKSITINPISDKEHILGNYKTAEVTIVEFSDLECPYCKTFHNALHTAYAKYPGKIAWVYRHFPLDSIHSKARNEAKASECAASIGGNTAFWKYIDMIFTNTPANNGLDENLLPVFAEKIGLNKSEFTKCLASNKLDSIVESQYQDGVRAGVEGTPHSILILKDGTQVPIKGADINGLNKMLEIVFK